MGKFGLNRQFFFFLFLISITCPRAHEPMTELTLQVRNEPLDVLSWSGLCLPALDKMDVSMLLLEGCPEPHSEPDSPQSKTKVRLSSIHFSVSINSVYLRPLCVKLYFPVLPSFTHNYWQKKKEGFLVYSITTCSWCVQGVPKAVWESNSSLVLGRGSERMLHTCRCCSGLPWTWVWTQNGSEIQIEGITCWQLLV